MNKGVKIFLISLVGIIVVLFAGFQWMTYNTKKLSPEQHVDVSVNGMDVHIFYCSPSVRERTIFGDLVPYGQVWRTGANEATTISFSEPVLIQGERLDAGNYSLWTIPEEEHWTIMFNKGEYPWGMNWDGTATYDSSQDATRVVAEVIPTENLQEQLRIALTNEPLQLEIQWEHVLIKLPIERI